MQASYSFQNPEVNQHSRHLGGLLCTRDGSNIVKTTRRKDLHTDRDFCVVKISRLDLGDSRHALWLGVKARSAVYNCEFVFQGMGFCRDLPPQKK